MASLFDEHDDEPSNHVAFAGNTLERLSENRSDTCLADAFGRSDTRAYVVCEGNLLLKTRDGAPDPLFLPDELEPLHPDRDASILLGYAEAGSARLIVPAATVLDHLPARIEAAGYRSLFAEGVLPPSLLGEFAQGASLLAWNRSSLFCGACGAATVSLAGGYRRQCTSCGKNIFPRSDPAVIMLAIDEKGDRCMLGRSPHFRPGVYSCLAGFVEPGETLEAAVRRETMEEAGITIGRVRYHASQPWPFPHQLMIGCYGEARTTEIVRHDAELEGCQWFDRSEIDAMLKSTSRGGFALPYTGSIAYRLIEDWLCRFAPTRSRDEVS